MQRLKSFWFSFFSFLFLYTVYDYIKHLRYDDTTFLDNAFDWFLFSAISVISLSVIIYGTFLIVNKVFKMNHFAFDGIGVAIAFITHINILGPYFNQTFWPHDSLLFHFRWAPFFFILGAFYFIRVAFYLLVERRNKQTAPTSE